MEHAIQEAQQALKLLMENKEQIIDLYSQMENVCSEYNENAATVSERQKNAGINRKCEELRGVLEPFDKAKFLIHEFLSAGSQYTGLTILIIKNCTNSSLLIFKNFIQTLSDSFLTVPIMRFMCIN